MMLRIPKRVVLPFGYHITVRQVTDSEMDRRDPNADGIWDNDTKPSSSESGRLSPADDTSFAHELGHAVVGLATPVLR
ncbi:MAG: hypothetical protein U0231_04905 [Nitrospiraceae bacterium]